MHAAHQIAFQFLKYQGLEQLACVQINHQVNISRTLSKKPFSW